MLMESEICNECGKRVELGRGLFVNRIPDFNDITTRIEMGKPFPEGEFICSECEETLEEKTNVGNQRIPD